MQIEYKITFRADGVTVAQNIQPDGGVPANGPYPQIPSQGTVESGYSLPGQPSMLTAPGSGFGDKTDPGGGFGDKTDPGGGFGDKTDPGGGFGDKTDPGGGFGDKTDPGGGAAGGGRPVVVLSCPVVITYLCGGR